MPSLFSDEDLREIQARIDKLTPETKALWGKMNVSQMLAHCQAPMNVGLGKAPLGKRNFIIRMIGRMVKNKLVKDMVPFKQNLPTDASFVVVGAPAFDVEKKKLQATVRQFSETGTASKLIGDHPFFGKLTQAEWDTLQWKHLDHHLRQFGV